MTNNDTQDDETGLYGKYEVYKNGEAVEDCFVLEPNSDHAARMALIAYAKHADDPELTDDLIEWVVNFDEDCAACGVNERATASRYCESCGKALLR